MLVLFPTEQIETCFCERKLSDVSGKAVSVDIYRPVYERGNKQTMAFSPPANYTNRATVASRPS
jgi:hypothetical protein